MIRHQACLNGDRTLDTAPGVPRSPAELAADAKAVVAAGADALHLHPRGADGLESLAPGDMAVALRAVRAAVPGIPVGVGTSFTIPPGGAARLAQIAAWDVVPDYASVNLSEPDAEDTLAVLAERGVGIEAGLWSRADAERWLSRPNRPCMRILIETLTDDVAEAQATYQAIRACLDESGSDVPLLLHGEGASIWPMLRQAIADGLAFRIGFEDVLLMPDGAPAPSNASMMAAAMSFRTTR